MVTFEEACSISSKLLTAERFRTLGVPEALRIWRERMAALGWTSEALMAESERRTRQHIAALRAAARRTESD
jgi:hypothetical protein